MAELPSDAVLDTLLREARGTQNAWQDRPVEDALLHRLWDLLRWGPTSANCSPARLFFLKSRAAKERLGPALSSNNFDKTMAAPVTAIVAYDTQFYEFLPKLFPRNPAAASWFTSSPAFAQETAVRNGTLQGGYLIIAARALGLDCGAMSGFKNAVVDQEFFPDGRLKSNFLCNLGYAVAGGLPPRDPRLAFDEACRIL
jgi:3-hydroxypropanoate dehydrogenase